MATGYSQIKVIFMHVQEEDMLKTVHLTCKALLHIEEENHDSWGFL